VRVTPVVCAVTWIRFTPECVDRVPEMGTLLGNARVFFPVFVVTLKTML